MSYPGQVFEDPEYYDTDEDTSWEDDHEIVDSYDPFETVNS